MSCGEAADGTDGQKAEALVPKRRPIRSVERGTCQKCREAKSKFIIRSAPYCTPCFELNVFSRFTRQLYPPLHPPEPTKSRKHSSNANLYRPARRASNVLVALSGGAGSMAMLDMLVRGGYVGLGGGDRKVADITKGEKEIIWERGYVVNVDFSGVLPPATTTEDEPDWLRVVVEQRGLAFIGLKAEDVFDPELTERLGGEPSSATEVLVDLKAAGLPIYGTGESSTQRAPLQKLQHLLASLPAPSRPSLLSTILTSLLRTTSHCLPKVSHLLVGETSTRQASRIISATASGRGWALPLELAPSVELPNGVLQINPMKEASLKEAAYVCQIHGIPTRNYRGWGKAGGSEKGRESRGKGGAMSIEGLTEQFIASLDVTHPATVSTITRTGGKLVFPGKEDEVLCPLCQMPKDHSALEWKARTALTSLGKTSADDKPDSLDTKSRTELARLLCYACLTTMTPAVHSKKGSKEESGAVEMPLWVGQRVRMNREEMRNEIAGFLIE